MRRPSAVMRVRSQSAQKGAVTEAIMPRLPAGYSPTPSAAPAATCHRLAGRRSDRPTSRRTKPASPSSARIRAAPTTSSARQDSRGPSGMCSMKRSCQPRRRHSASRRGARRPIEPGIATALILMGPRPASCAPTTPRRTPSRRSRRVIAAYSPASRVSIETLTRSSPAVRSPAARLSRPSPFVVSPMSGLAPVRRVRSEATAATISSRSRRMSGSPPVRRIRSTPRRSTAIRARRAISRASSSDAVGSHPGPASGMQ